VTASLVKGAQGQPLYVVEVVEDVNQAKQAQFGLQESEERLRDLAARLISAQEDERKRISRELHDEVGQALLVMKLQSRAFEQGLLPEQQQLRGECREVLAGIDQLVENVRRLSRDLSPTSLEDLGLSASLQRLLREFSKHYHLECEVRDFDIDGLFPPEAQLAIYRIFQESLTNVGKHSQASRLTVAIKRAGYRVSFLIEDNGRGCRMTGRERASGLGWAAMEERARMVGGTLAIWSKEGQGTRISFQIPFSPEKH
jgi:signal transduction histidine kinase